MEKVEFKSSLSSLGGYITLVELIPLLAERPDDGAIHVAHRISLSSCGHPRKADWYKSMYSSTIRSMLKWRARSELARLI